MKRIACLAVPFALLLAGCEDSAPEAGTSEQGGEVTGDVLGGTISDDMLPLEELKSQSPPAKRTAETGSSGNTASPSATAAEDAPAEEAPASEAPAEATGE